ncbi:putative glycerol-3-phosphate acyltransferase [compost metagenome]
MLKGVAAVWVGRLLGGDSEWIAALCGIAAIIGHNWPIYFRFRGGKGIATTLGVMATLTFFPVLIAGIIAILSIIFTKYVSLGSLIFVLLTPIFLVFSNEISPYFWASLIICVFAFWRHRTNIVKIAQGKENKLGSKGGKRVA